MEKTEACNYNIKPCDYVICYDDITGVIHHIPSKRMVKCSPKLAKVLKEGIEQKQINAQVSQYLAQHFERNGGEVHVLQEFSPKRRLARLEIMVTTCCNLNCVYCYAGGGNYGRDQESMTLETADAIMKYVAKNYDEVGEVVFFGGEPLLGYQIIMHVCERFEELPLKQPEYKIVSNFTFLPEEFIDYIGKYHIVITASIDGPREITNRLRISRQGNTDTYEKVVANIQRLKERELDIRCIECTYTEEHLKQGYTKEKIIEFFKENFGEYGLFLCDENAYAAKQLEQKATTERQIYNELYDVLHRRVLQGWYSVTGEEHFCGAGIITFSVFPNGDIYPCHNFGTDQKWCMGNIYDDKWEQLERCCILRAELKKLQEKCICKSCTARENCIVCVAELIFQWGGNAEASCEWKCKRNEELLLDFCRQR